MASGRERVFFDLIGGYGGNNFGHGHPAIRAALRMALEELDHVAVFPSGQAQELARRLVKKCGFASGRCYFTVGGSQAVEIALRIGRLLTGKPGIAVMEGAFHGYGAETVALSRDYVPEELMRVTPAAAPVTRLAWNDERAFAQLSAAAQTTGTLLFEPILGAAGFRVPDARWLGQLLELARELGMLSIADEIQVGCGRTGKFLAIEHLVGPRSRRRSWLDGVLLSKSLAGSVYPLSAVVLNADRTPGLSTIDETAALGESFTNSPLGCAAALAALDLLEADGGALMSKAARLVGALRRQLERAAATRRSCTVRGLGATIAVDFGDKRSATQFVRRAFDQGVLCYVCGGHRWATVKLIPPLTLTPQEAEEVGGRLIRALEMGA
ncbi:MAG: aminotransferase class III-fold pyridoxal phosphate-dependent enzyme [Candidatus Wallbacteria bacterium]|nr:aminotransferase class III-fold pyridoxal phosphate-dependent enzyme [Candidatus Wallbacteria bacterium]